jgi:ribosomal silencing factor RsfS
MDLDTPTMKDILDRMAGLELENRKLRTMVLSTNKEKIEKRAKMLCYHDNKTRPDILSALEERLEKSGLVIRKSNGKAMLPWRLVKVCTDVIWKEMSEEDREEYRVKAIIG